MKCFAFLLLSQCVVGFSPAKITPRHTVLSAADGGKGDFPHNVASMAATLALGLTIGASSVTAAPTMDSGWAPTTSTSSSFMVAYSDSDFADFSLPSYKEVTNAAINSNLKGGKNLLPGSEPSASTSSSVADTPAPAPAPAPVEKKEPTAADIKAEKAAAKAAAQAGRAAQQAAIEAAIAAKAN